MGNKYQDKKLLHNRYRKIKDMKGKPNGVFHVPGHTVRALRTRQGFIQERNGTKVYFKIFKFMKHPF